MTHEQAETISAVLRRVPADSFHAVPCQHPQHPQDTGTWGLTLLWCCEAASPRQRTVWTLQELRVALRDLVTLR